LTYGERDYDGLANDFLEFILDNRSCVLDGSLDCILELSRASFEFTNERGTLVYQLWIGLLEVRLERIDLTSGTGTQTNEAGGDLRISIDLVSDGLCDESGEGSSELRVHFI
jgi:hypothetical protein